MGQNHKVSRCTRPARHSGRTQRSARPEFKAMAKPRLLLQAHGRDNSSAIPSNNHYPSKCASAGQRDTNT